MTPDAQMEMKNMEKQYAEDKRKQDCVECGKERQCSHFNDHNLTRWQAKVCRPCFVAWYEVVE